MIVGVFHPTLNLCGGAEWVAINIINNLRNHGYRTVVLTNERIDHNKILKIFGIRVRCDTNVVFPFECFGSTDLHNVYTDGLRTLILRWKCDVLIDTQSNALLPGVNLTYIHFPLFGRLEEAKVSRFRIVYYFPYRLYERRKAKNPMRLVLSNSKYTSHAVKRITGADSIVLYPPVSKVFYASQNDLQDKENVVVSVARISPYKRQIMIPQIAGLTNKKIRFIIVGLKDSSSILNQVLEYTKRNGLSDRVEVFIDVSREKLLGILRTSKVFLHPARGEHFGVSIAEAMAAGCIPLVHNTGGPREFVPERWRFNESKEAAQKIERAILEWSPNKAEEIICLAQAFSEARFSAKFLETFEAYEETYLQYQPSKD